MKIRQVLSVRHRIIDIEYQKEEVYNSYQIIVSFIEIDQMAYLTIFPYDEQTGCIITASFIILS